jgi:VanZ family protein
MCAGIMAARRLPQVALPVRTAILSLTQSTPARVMMPLLWMAVIFVLSHQPTLPYPDDVDAMIVSTLGHVTVYAVLAGLLWWALGAFSVPAGWRYVLPVAISALYGISDEWHQSYVPGRSPDARDVVADTVGAVLAMLVVAWLVRRGTLDPEA